MEDTEHVDTAEETIKPKLRSSVGEKDVQAGIIYLSRIPTYMSVKKIRHIFGQYGKLDRIFLQPDEKAPDSKKNRVFSEGWIEFLNKKIAKRVALSLNNTQIGGKRRSKWFEEIWSMKYLPKFKWTHLNERLAYEREVHKQRLRTEVTQAKKEANFYIKNVEKKAVMKRLEKKAEKRGETFTSNTKEFLFKQKDTEEEIVSRKRKQREIDSKGPAAKKSKKPSEAAKKKALDKSFLKSLFSGGVQGKVAQNESDT